MEKYNWTTSQIDDEDFWRLWEIEFKDKLTSDKPNDDDEIVPIDEFRRRARNGDYNK